MTNTKAPPQPAAIFVSHGGGPLPVLGDPGHHEMVEHLGRIASEIQKPSAIVVVSAHWEESEVTITAHTNPPIIYDYYGFPPDSYSLEYPAPGHPELAKRLADSLAGKGIEARLDNERGFDHGMYIPLLLMYPEADIPCVQLSLLSSLDPEKHIQIGTALSDLSRDNILVLGSGFSFHNLKVLMGGKADEFDDGNEEFESWLIETCTSSDIDESTRSQRLIDWERAPSARYCHPREEHLLPLHMCYGVTMSACIAHAELKIMGKRSSTYFW
ncbi:MAG: class III extradiol ring-cleavage dioxygenase [Pseudomonadota bacterium]